MCKARENMQSVKGAGRHVTDVKHGKRWGFFCARTFVTQANSNLWRGDVLVHGRATRDLAPNVFVMSAGEAMSLSR